MPAKVLPSAEAFGKFREAMMGLGFRELLPIEFKKDWWRLRLVAPSPREGREVGFSYTANGLEVRVWTTFLASEGSAREKDEGWVLIKSGDRARYFTHPLRRTKHFLRRLYFWAQVVRFRVLDRPLCPVCGAYMRIAFGKAPKSRYWHCMRIARHQAGRPVWVDWDYALRSRPKALAFVLKERKKRERYRDKAREEGRPLGAALRRRRGWRVTRPDNIVPAR